MTSLRVLPIRPYEDRIRDQVFRCLQAAGLSVDSAGAIPPDTEDAEVVRLLADRSPSALLIPYHARTFPDGTSSNGLELAQRIEEELPRLVGVPILMPVSAAAIQGVRGLLAYRTRRGPVSEALRERVLLIDETELEDPELPRRILSHLGRVEG